MSIPLKRLSSIRDSGHEGIEARDSDHERIEARDSNHEGIQPNEHPGFSMNRDALAHRDQQAQARAAAPAPVPAAAPALAAAPAPAATPAPAVSIAAGAVNAKSKSIFQKRKFWVFILGIPTVILTCVQIWATIYAGETQKRANDLAAQANEVAAASARTAFATLCNTL